MTKIIIILASKGGVGKTTVAYGLAAAAARDGRSVATLDTDPQGSLSYWWGKRPAEMPEITHYQRPLADIRADGLPVGTDILIVDTPTAIEFWPTGTHALIDKADLILVPTGAKTADILSVTAMSEFARARRPAVPLAFILNQTKPRMLATEDARLKLGAFGDVAPPALPELAEIERTFALGVGILDLERARSSDIWLALWRYAKQKLLIQEIGQ